MIVKRLLPWWVLLPSTTIAATVLAYVVFVEDELTSDLYYTWLP
jgi:hypothetical protein